jgi:hypothetical protein
MKKLTRNNDLVNLEYKALTAVRTFVGKRKILIVSQEKEIENFLWTGKAC